MTVSLTASKIFFGGINPVSNKDDLYAEFEQNFFTLIVLMGKFLRKIIDEKSHISPINMPIQYGRRNLIFSDRPIILLTNTTREFMVKSGLSI